MKVGFIKMPIISTGFAFVAFSYNANFRCSKIPKVNPLKKDNRTLKVTLNVLLSAVLRVVGLLCSLAVVPLTLGYLNTDVYGVWMTITSVLYWFSFFDVGLGNGMRNYLTASISKGRYEEGRAYLTSTFYMLTIISLAMGLVAVPLTMMADLNGLLNIDVVSSESLRMAMLIAIVFTLVMFVVKNVGYVFVALQMYALNDLLAVGGNVLALGAIYLLTCTTEGNLVYVVSAFVIIPVFVYLLAALPIFAYYKELRPKRSAFDFSLVRPIVSKGMGFFLIQITSCLVIFASSNVFITRFNGAESAAIYGIAYKYFHLIAMAYTIVLAPMWNAYTDAYVKGDFPWVRRTFRRALGIWVLTLLGGAVMLYLAPLMFTLWIGSIVEIPMSVSMAVLAYISMYNLNNCVTYLLNGFNKIRVQIITSIVFTVVYLASVFTVRGSYGIEGIVYSMAACYAAMALIHLYQCRLLIHEKATGIWNK